MHDARDLDARRAEALAALSWFTSHLLRSQLWRSSRGRHRPAAVRRQWLEDLQQELAVDCLDRVDEVLASTPQERHRQWFRLVERWLYRESRHGTFGRLERDEDASAAPTEPAEAGAAPRPRRVLEGELLPSGRPNITATAQRNGVPRRQVRELWTEAAERAGYDAAFLAFWRRRLAEALLGLAADQLLDRGQVHVLPRRRRRPDPRARLRRIRRILRVLSVRPVPHALRKAIAAARLRGGARSTDPSHLLQAALLLSPGDPTVLLWQFEAAMMGGDLALAARSLRLAREGGADPVATALARARLLGRRGRATAARFLLLRLSRRWPRDERPREALRLAAARTNGGTQPPVGAALSAGATPRSTRSSASASSSSSHGSGRGEDHSGSVANTGKPR